MWVCRRRSTATARIAAMTSSSTPSASMIMPAAACRLISTRCSFPTARSVRRGQHSELFSADAVIAVIDPVYPVYVDSNAMAGRAGEYADGKWDRLVYLPCNAVRKTVSRLRCRIKSRGCDLPLLPQQPD